MSGLIPDSNQYGLLTDLYQLTMSACYVGEGIAEKPASFELFTRHLPPEFGYLVAMGLEQALDYLENFHFTAKQISDLQATGIFANAPAAFWDLLAVGRFTGDVWAVPEGTLIFAHEPLLRIDAPLWQAQIVETYLLNTINYQTLIATRAARLRDTAGPTATLLEFGTRRAFSPQASLWAARAAIAAGLDGTSNVQAALNLEQKPVGTMAHALVMAIAALEGDEDEAFNAFSRYFPQAPLLIDTYDTIAAAKRLGQAVQTGQRQVTGVRLDSGDLVALSQQVQTLLPDVQIFASGDLDEWEIARLQATGAQLSGYGIGTRLVSGQPVNGVYKLVEIDGVPTMKQSSHKATYPGRKQIFRHWDGDRLGLHPETPQSQEQPLLQRVMHQGRRYQKSEPLSQIRQRTAAQVQRLPPATRALSNPVPWNVSISEPLQALRQSLLAARV
ncbi:MAG: nicotinate phosphoribosyltransferase [Cyanobacteria bacterium P01_G01_bin.54]